MIFINLTNTSEPAYGKVMPGFMLCRFLYRDASKSVIDSPDVSSFGVNIVVQ